MKIQIKRDAEFIEVGKIIIQIDGKDFRISETKFKELCINKYHDEDSRISIVPQSSNEILVL